jgi:hypothetical protein
MNTAAIKYVIRWSRYGYVTKRSPRYRPYASNSKDLDVKTWRTYMAAERFLSLKDPVWASQCVIEEVNTNEYKCC